MSEWDDPQEVPDPVAVPHKALSTEALLGVIESFVLREGTDYGERDVPHDDKVAHVMLQLERGEAQIMFDPLSATIHIVQRQRPRRGRDPGDTDPGTE